jgi:Viral BACON domain/Putative binding domain, N-terminal
MYSALSRDLARVCAVLLLLGFVGPAAASGQSIVDARRVEFTPSTDHSVVDSGGAALVTNYSLSVFVAGGVTAVATANLGKPAPDPDGMIRLDFIALLTGSLTPGVVYETVVSAVGPGGVAEAPRTNTFSFSLPCTPSISPVSQSIAAAGGTGSSTVSVAAGCAWTAVSNAAWITVTTGGSGSGPATVSYSVAVNPATVSRTGTLTIAGSTLTVTQAATPCSYSISPTSLSIAGDGGAGSVAVTTTAGCAWTASSGVPWVTMTTGTSGTDSGTSTFSVAANTGSSARSASLTIAGQTFTVSQAAACSYTVSPPSLVVNPPANSGTLSVTTQSGCTWTTTSSASWLTITSPSGTGNGSSSWTVVSNVGAPARTGTISIAGKTITVTQNGLPAPPVNVRIIR